jgi:hypothetical protein
MRPALTVLTTPIRSLPRRLYQGFRTALRPLVKPGVPLPETPPYPGHASLVRSVVSGLRAIEADFNFNPRGFGELARVVYAPANEALLQAVSLKRRGRIDSLTAGPVNALFPDDCGGILRLAEIDQIIVASEWVVDFYRREAPELTNKIRICTSGVDPEFWNPSPGRRRGGKAVLYWKTAPEPLCRQSEAAMRRFGLDPMLVRYGEYDAASYRRVLDEAEVAVFLSTFETQGLALAEAWSMDVPTLVWDPRGEAEWRGRTFRSGSSCPYLTEATGLPFHAPDDLEAALDCLSAKRDGFRPRDWVLSHMTDAICAEALYRILLADHSRRS